MYKAPRVASGVEGNRCGSLELEFFYLGYELGQCGTLAWLSLAWLKLEIYLAQVSANQKF